MLCHVWHCVGDWAARRPLAACGQRVHVVCAVNRACCAAISIPCMLCMCGVWFLILIKSYTCKKRCACSSLIRSKAPLVFSKETTSIQLHAFERKRRRKKKTGLHSHKTCTNIRLYMFISRFVPGRCMLQNRKTASLKIGRDPPPPRRVSTIPLSRVRSRTMSRAAPPLRARVST
jgi:hypothetical protein